jgi:small subunit ribosomal protein S9
MEKKNKKPKEKEKKKSGVAKKTKQKVVKKEEKKKPKKATSKPIGKKKEERKKIVKETAKTNPEEKEMEEDFTITKTKKYFEAVGRRKTSRARVRLYTQGEKSIKVNGKSYSDYFSTLELQKIVESPLDVIKSLNKFKVLVTIKGGGIHAQAEALRHGISRALCLLNPYFKKRLRKAGFITRDPRVRERKKFGLRRARRAPQWSKR